MYVCLCHGVTDHAIREAVDQGVSTLKELSLKTGCATQCGCCASTAREILEDSVARRDQVEMPVVYKPVFAA